MAYNPLLTEIEVRAVEDLSPSFRRVRFGAPALAECGTGGPVYDQRIKILLPSAVGRLPSVASLGGEWYEAWRNLPDDDRGFMRTYSIRSIDGSGAGREVVVDFVLHLAEGATGPASDWAAKATVGDKVIMVLPRIGSDVGGIEFDPAGASRLLLAGDETAAPAIARILGDLPESAVGTVFLEVPEQKDVLDDVARPPGVTVTWLPREGRRYGECLFEAVVSHLGGSTRGASPEDVAASAQDAIWETPTYPAPDAEPAAGEGIPGLYAWIAGESGVVTRLRRHLVKDLGVDRKQVAFMGYWRVGAVMG